MSENFDITIKKDRFFTDPNHQDILLSVTHNGYQWTTISFDNIAELISLKRKINDFLDTNVPERPHE